MLTLHSSNRTESLVEALAAVVARPLGDPFAAEHIVVQGKGMERWLSMQLASRLGVWANPAFPFPRRIVEMALAPPSATPSEAQLLCEPETMLWAIAASLGELARTPPFAEIAAYLRDDRNDVKKLQLAERIADTFDHYTVYRPEMVLGWEAGKDDHWQAILWRRLNERQPLLHLARRIDVFKRASVKSDSLPESFPARLSFFGLSTLPPLYLDLLNTLSTRTDIHLFVLNPSREYWGDVRSRRERAREASRRGDAATPASIGNPLLSSLGRLGRDFLNLLLDKVEFDAYDDDRFEPPRNDTALGQLQSDIFRLVHRTSRSAEDLGFETVDAREPPRDLVADDDSIRIHSCHGPMREVEVLRDQLLALFDADPTLHPHDVIVMTPAIDTYAPYVEAVFSGRRASAEQPLAIRHASEVSIPFRIADRGARAVNPVYEAFCTVIDVLRGRLSAPEVLDLLGIELVREKFEIDADEVDTVRRWVTEAGIRWGVDGADRETAGLPPFEENSWRFGLERLFLGYAMEGRDRSLFCGVLPYDDVEGKSAATLGKLASLCETLFSFRSRVTATHTPATWNDLLTGLLSATLARPPSVAQQHDEISIALSDIARSADRAGFAAEIDLASMRARLDSELTRLGSARGFLGGGVTFCELVPMRTIPFRVVCLVGLNDGTFPRTRRPLGFDLMAQNPIAGDRTQRDDDRYLFLEALLSARERLLITFTGQSVHDNRELPPSVVVSELLDALRESFHAKPSVEELVVVHHPLQAFSPLYFTSDRDPRLFSYSTACAAAARTMTSARQDHPSFLDKPLPTAAGTAEVSLDALVRFLDLPLRHFCQKRLGVHLDDSSEIVPEREPVALSALERWKIGDILLRAAQNGQVPVEMADVVRARGLLPPGALGRAAFGAIEPGAARIAAEAEKHARNRVEPHPFDLTFDTVRLSGTLTDLTRAGPLAVQFSSLGKYHELRVWVRHLVWQLVTPAGYGSDSILVGRQGENAGIVRFRPVSDAKEHLSSLIELYRVGFDAPVPLLQDASRAYARILRDGRGESEALEAARKAFAGNTNDGYGDAYDPYVRLVYGREGDPARAFARILEQADRGQGTFETIALRVWAPMLEHREEVGG